jgi:hypothetical protein
MWTRFAVHKGISSTGWLLQLSQPFPYSLIPGTHDAEVNSIAKVIRKNVLINLKLRLQFNVRATSGKSLLKNYTLVRTV